MKKLQMLIVLVVSLGTVAALSSFKPEKGPSEKSQLVLIFNAKPVAVRCLTAAGTPFAVQTTCMFNPGTSCRPNPCPAGPIAIGFKPVVINCTAGGAIVGFGNTCTAAAGSICSPNPC